MRDSELSAHDAIGEVVLPKAAEAGTRNAALSGAKQISFEPPWTSGMTGAYTVSILI
ncbi:MAG TPA: hypothetical protein VJX66_03555 [Amycolatopsis sp.]|nr:hypothetical protein [Amycolatopsis sp.]